MVGGIVFILYVLGEINKLKETIGTVRPFNGVEPAPSNDTEPAPSNDTESGGPSNGAEPAPSNDTESGGPSNDTETDAPNGAEPGGPPNGGESGGPSNGAEPAPSNGAEPGPSNDTGTGGPFNGAEPAHDEGLILSGGKGTRPRHQRPLQDVRWRRPGPEPAPGDRPAPGRTSRRRVHTGADRPPLRCSTARIGVAATFDGAHAARRRRPDADGSAPPAAGSRPGGAPAARRADRP